MTPYSNDEVDYHYVTDEDMKKLLDAEWNKAIEAVVENTESYSLVHRWNVPIIDKDRILKLKR